MSSFYGNGGGGLSSSKAQELINNHIIFSKTEPTSQKTDDVWMIIKDYTDPFESQEEDNTGN